MNGGMVVRCYLPAGLLHFTLLCRLSQGEGPGEHILILCNAIGSPIDSRHVDITPQYLALAGSTAVAASDTRVYTWQFRAAGSCTSGSAAAGGGSSAVAALGTKQAQLQRERMFHIDQPANVQVRKQARGLQPALPAPHGLCLVVAPRRPNPLGPHLTCAAAHMPPSHQSCSSCRLAAPTPATPSAPSLPPTPCCLSGVRAAWCTAMACRH